MRSNDRYPTNITDCSCLNNLVTDIDNNCHDCPIGANCSSETGSLTLDQIVPLNGYWRAHESSWEFFKCENIFSARDAHLATERCCPPGRCKQKSNSTSKGSFYNFSQNDQCGEAYAGPLCNGCAPGFTMLGSGKCEACEETSIFAKYTVSLLMWFSVVFVCTLTVLWISKGDSTYQMGDRLKTTWGKIAIIMMNAQILALIPMVFDASFWPDLFVSFTLPLRLLVNVDLIRLVSFNSCFFSMHFLDRLVLHMMLPIIYCVGTGVACAVAGLCPKKCRMRINRKYKALRILTFGILLMYPSCSQIILSSFKCRSVSHEQTKTVIFSVLASSPEVVCFETAHHQSILVTAFIFLFLYIVGLPLLIFMGLKANRSHLYNVKSSKHTMVRSALGTLYLPYERSYYWFELINMATKMMM